jgi:uncharacterized membrane protein YidH (DUF202 family)
MDVMFGVIGVSIFGILAFLVAAAIGVAVFAFWIWMLIHAITNKGLDNTERIIWVLVVLFLHALGALIYFFVGRPKATG